MKQERHSFDFARRLCSIAFSRDWRWLPRNGGFLRVHWLSTSGWGTALARRKDMDLVRHDDEESATADLIACHSVEFDDFFVFAIEKAGQITEEQDGGAIRYRVRAELAARLFERVTVDIGFSDALGWQPERLQVPDLLSFAGIEPIEVPTVPIEQHIAEKVHAYTRIYGDGRQSSRVKDLVDLVLIKHAMTADAVRLRAALLGVFEARGQQALPDVLPEASARVDCAVSKACGRSWHRSRSCSRTSRSGGVDRQRSTGSALAGL